MENVGCRRKTRGRVCIPMTYEKSGGRGAWGELRRILEKRCKISLKQHRNFQTLSNDRYTQGLHTACIKVSKRSRRYEVLSL